MENKSVPVEQQYVNQLEEALYRILDSNRLDVAKEIASDILGEDLEEYLEKDLNEIDFADDSFDGELDYALLDNDYDN